MKVLIIASRFFMGGFSKSLINFLLCADRYPELDITVLTLQKNETEDYKEIPGRFRYISYDSLAYKEKPRRGLNSEYLFNKQRVRNLEYVFTDLLCKLKKQPFPYATMIKFMSFSEAERAKRVTTDFSFCADFDVAISWEELFCNYFLVEKIPVKHKIGYIHPNYNEVGFSKVADKPCLEKLDAIVTVSESCKETLCRVYPEFEAKIHYIPNRLNLERTERLSKKTDPHFKAGIPHLLTVCRMSDHDKAIFRIVKLCKRLVQEGYVFQWSLIGNGLDYIELNKRIHEEELENVIICLGQLDNPLPYVKKADLYVQQSYAEGRPVSVDEAIALNTPALVTNYSSAYEQVEHGRTGWVVENNEEAIYRQLKKLFEMPELLVEAKNQLKQRDKKQFEDCSLMIELLHGVCKMGGEKA